MVPFSRVGPYDRTAFDQLIYGTGEFAEHWAHEISIVPAETWPLLRYRRETDRVRPWGFAKVLEERADYAAWVLEEVRRRCKNPRVLDRNRTTWRAGSAFLERIAGGCWKAIGFLALV